MISPRSRPAKAMCSSKVGQKPFFFMAAVIRNGPLRTVCKLADIYKLFINLWMVGNPGHFWHIAKVKALSSSHPPPPPCLHIPSFFHLHRAQEVIRSQRFLTKSRGFFFCTYQADITENVNGIFSRLRKSKREKCIVRLLHILYCFVFFHYFFLSFIAC